MKKEAYNFDKNTHSIYTLNYHLGKVLSNEKIIEELKYKTKQIAGSYSIEILSIETDLDHIHILFKAKPQTNLLKFINNRKSATSKTLRNKFPGIKQKLWKDVF